MYVRGYHLIDTENLDLDNLTPMEEEELRYEIRIFRKITRIPVKTTKAYRERLKQEYRETREIERACRKLDKEIQMQERRDSW